MAYPKNRQNKWSPCTVDGCEGKIVAARNKSGKCRKCMQDQCVRRWMDEHPEQFQVIQKRWRANNVEQTRVRCREFYQSPHGKAVQKQYVESNRDKVNQHSTNYAKRHPTRIRARKYGLTEEQFHSLLKSQSGLCKICKTPTDKTLHIDHCHTTGRVRGLLCFRCNNLLGSAKDNPDILQAAIQYLKDSQ